METETISAIATPIGSSGIGIVRISGPKAIEIAQEIFLPAKRSSLEQRKIFFNTIESHRLYYGFISDPKKGGIVDEVLMVLMRSPNSYTREDVVEIQSHAGYVILSIILKLTIEFGSRIAEPGEFTKRAFLNGRIDLSQAEAIAQMISARSETELKMAATHLTGAIRDEINQIIDTVTQIQVHIEASIEFPEEVDEIDDHETAENIESTIILPIRYLIENYDNSHVLRDGIRLDIVGRPNVGKSSLLNAILSKDKAIVTDLPGTTRDLIEDYIDIGGIPVILTDTAGLHHTENPVEKIGIQKTKENIQKSDLVLWLVDCHSGIIKEDHEVFEQITCRNILLVVNKKDLSANTENFHIPEKLQQLDTVFISAKYGDGLDELKDAIKHRCLKSSGAKQISGPIPNIRQKSALKKAKEYFLEATKRLFDGSTEDMVIEEINSGKIELESITGENVSQDVMDEIFGKFCIGK